MGLPPLLTGGVKVTLACALPPVAVAPVGASGTVAGVTLFDGAEGALEPTALAATTVNVYAVPFVRPVTTCVVKLLPSLLSMPPAGFEITV
jgi:hypothetical protein